MHILIVRINLSKDNAKTDTRRNVLWHYQMLQSLQETEAPVAQQHQKKSPVLVEAPVARRHQKKSPALVEAPAAQRHRKKSPVLAEVPAVPETSRLAASNWQENQETIQSHT